MNLFFLALGSNLGDRLGHLRFALVELEQRGISIERKSKIYRSDSVDSGGEGEFLNAALRGRTALSALELLAHCQEIERLAGRDKPDFQGAKRLGSRTLDLDILHFNDEIVHSPTLQLPHPRALSRPFVLRPLLDVLDGGGVVESGFDW